MEKTNITEFRLKNIIKKCKAGDMNAFDTLMREFQSSVFGYAYKLCNNYEDANDITNLTFIKLLEAIKTYREDSHFKGWLLTIVKNTYIDMLRSETNRKNAISIDNTDEEGGQMEIRDESPNPMTQILEEEKKEILRKIIDSLPQIHRQPLILYFVEGLSYKEISDKLGISMGTTKSRINRGTEILKNRFIAEYMEKELPKRETKSLPS